MPDIITVDQHLQQEERLHNSEDELLRALVILRGLVYTLEGNNSIIHVLREHGDEHSRYTYEGIVSVLYLLLDRLEALDIM